MSCEDWLGVWNGLVFLCNTVSLYCAFESVLAWQKSQELLHYSLKAPNCNLYTQLETQGVKAGLLNTLVQVHLDKVGHWQLEAPVRKSLLCWACK